MPPYNQSIDALDDIAKAQLACDPWAYHRLRPEAHSVKISSNVEIRDIILEIKPSGLQNA